MTSPEYSTGFCSDRARRAMAIVRTRRAANSSRYPGCSRALRPAVRMYESRIAPAPAATATSSASAFNTGVIPASLLRLLGELRRVLQEFLARLLGAEVV